MPSGDLLTRDGHEHGRRLSEGDDHGCRSGAQPGLQRSLMASRARRRPIARQAGQACARLAGVSRIVYISGRPGAGKRSLAFPLAAELGYSLVTKDMVKEALHDALYVPGEGKIGLAWSRRLGAASFARLGTLAARAGDMVIEANFDPHNDEALGQLGGLGGRGALRVPRRGRSRPVQRTAEARGPPGDAAAVRNGQIRPAGRHRLADHRGHDRAGRRRGRRRRGPPPAHQLRYTRFRYSAAPASVETLRLRGATRRPPRACRESRPLALS